MSKPLPPRLLWVGDLHDSLNRASWGRLSQTMQIRDYVDPLKKTVIFPVTGGLSTQEVGWCREIIRKWAQVNDAHAKTVQLGPDGLRATFFIKRRGGPPSRINPFRDEVRRPGRERVRRPGRPPRRDYLRY